MTLVKQGTTTPIGATVVYTASTFKATLTPTAALTAATTYVARAKGGTGGIKDVAGNVLAADVTWTFTTAAAGGTTAYLSDLRTRSPPTAGDRSRRIAATVSRPAATGCR